MQPLSDNEAERLFELHATHILDSPPALEFDDLVAHARDLFDVPICLISLVDEQRQWFKARCGLDVSETPRDMAFCQYTILGNDLLVVEDATKDVRFRNNRLVTGIPHIRFYAGAPLLIRPGVALGSLCVIDSKPRSIADREREALRRLSHVAVGLIKGHKRAHEAIARAAEADRSRAIVEEQRRLLELRERRFKQTEMAAKVGGWEIDIARQSLQWSDEIYRIHDIPIGTPVTLAMARSAYPEAEKRHLEALFAEAIDNGKGYDDYFELISATGVRKWVRSTCEVEFIDGKAVRLFGTSQDVSDHHKVQIALWDAANRDSLTRLSNRKHFCAMLEKVFAGPSEAGLLMIDVDHLKEVNDTLGHAAGDELIKTVAARLTSCIAPDDTVARIGGDEFAIVVNGPCSPADIKAVGEAVLRAMQPESLFADRTIKPRVCVGGAVRHLEDTADSLCQKADLALYHAKKTRRGSYAAFHQDLRKSNVERITVLQQIERGLADDWIIPRYQPVVSLHNSEIVGFEALATLQPPGKDMIHAKELSQAFRDFSLARRVTDRVLTKVAHDMRTWLDAGIAFRHVGVNLSNADLHDADLFSRLTHAFSLVGVPLKHVIVEVMETVFTDDRDHAIGKRIQQIRDRGMLVALDDFGAGHASLTHLRSVPVDIIKVSSSFIAGMLTEASSGAIVETLVDLGRRLGVRIVADGIEDVAQFDHLLELGCTLGQGNYFGPPTDCGTAAYMVRAFGHRRESGTPEVAAA